MLSVEIISASFVDNRSLAFIGYVTYHIRMTVTTPHESSREPAPGDLAVVQAFVNTLDSDDGFQQFELLDQPADLERWLRDRGLLERGVRLGAADLRRAIELRQALRSLLLTNNGAPLDPQAVEALNRAAGRAHSSFRFDDAASAELVPAVRGLDGAIARLLAFVAAAMADGTWRRLKACRNPTCEWAFYDRSRNRSSRWCTMSECGNRAKARAFRERHA
jgi:predicted RNA-binding Zn ribbon-like protein